MSIFKTSVFNTNRYTIESLISEVSSLTPNQVKNVSSLAATLSPRAGLYSAKIAFLNSYVGGDISAVINGTKTFSTYGKTPRTRLVTALRRRQSRNS